jgi:hypothetical protein
MFASISAFGWFHTGISILPIFIGLYAFLRDGKIDPRNWVGFFYLLTMFLGSITSWGFIPEKGFGPPQLLTLLTLALLIAGTWWGPGYVQTISLSASYFLLLFFATTETLTRVPVGHPFASGPTDPALVPTRLVLLAAFLIGLTYQLIVLRNAPAQEPAPAQ